MLEKNCGVIIYTRINKALQYVLIKDLNGNYGFPKGIQKENETITQTAKRQAKEKTGLDITLIENFQRRIFYPLDEENEKEVTFFIGTYRNQEYKANEEITGIELVTYKQALELLKHKDELDIFMKAHEVVVKL